MKTTGLLIWIIALSALGFIVWVVLLAGFWWFLRLWGVAPDLWSMIEALSTALAAAAVVSAGFVAYRELSEISNTRSLEVIDRLFDELNSTENIDARRWVFQNLPTDPEAGIPTLSTEERQKIKQVLNSLDRVAFLTQPGWIDEALVMPWMNPMVVKAWSKLEPYVDYERQRRKEPDYYQSARQLALRCQAWRKEHLPEAEITWVEDAL
jgi:hypothetical protein